MEPDGYRWCEDGEDETPVAPTVVDDAPQTPDEVPEDPDAPDEPVMDDTSGVKVARFGGGRVKAGR